MGLTALAEAGLLVQAHLLAAAAAILLGIVQFARRKGTRWHKTLGWAWIGCAAVTAVTSLFIQNLNEGGYSLTHLFTVITIIGLPIAVYAIRSGDVLLHRNTMIAVYTGALIIAFFFTLTPGRLLHRILFGEPPPAAAAPATRP
jgi:uncharacterized membrane protein